MPKRDTIVMKKSDLLKEHKRLLKLLDVGNKMVRESKSQRTEMKKYI